VLDAVITGPAVILDGILNGPTGALLPTPEGNAGYGPNIGPLASPPFNVFSPGILTPNLGFELPLTIVLPGPIGAVLTLLQAIATEIDPPAATTTAASTPQASVAATNAPSAVPNMAASTVTVPTTQTPKTGQAGVSAGTSANAGPAATVTGTTIKATTGLTAGKKSTGLTGANNTTGGQVSSTVSKALSGLTGGLSHVPTPAGHK
jgi:hypothetical protein